MLDHVVDELVDLYALRFGSLLEIAEHLTIEVDWEAQLGILSIELTAFAL
jgi:hypothetical protein